MTVELWDRIVNGGVLLIAIIAFMYPLHIKNRQRAEEQLRQLSDLGHWAKKHERQDKKRFKALFSRGNIPSRNNAPTEE
jgi:hypothetical protein